jgi:hypothetical protein
MRISSNIGMVDSPLPKQRLRVSLSFEKEALASADAVIYHDDAAGSDRPSDSHGHVDGSVIDGDSASRSSLSPQETFVSDDVSTKAVTERHRPHRPRMVSARHIPVSEAEATCSNPSRQPAKPPEEGLVEERSSNAMSQQPGACVEVGVQTDSGSMRRGMRRTASTPFLGRRGSFKIARTDSASSSDTCDAPSLRHCCSMPSFQGQGDISGSQLDSEESSMAKLQTNMHVELLTNDYDGKNFSSGILLSSWKKFWAPRIDRSKSWIREKIVPKARRSPHKVDNTQQSTHGQTGGSRQVKATDGKRKLVRTHSARELIEEALWDSERSEMVDPGQRGYVFSGTVTMF